LADLSEIAKGDKVLFFTNIWAPNAVHMGQIVKALESKSKATIVQVNTDHQVSTCSDFGIRTAPTLVRLKDGKEVDRIEDIPAEDPNQTILKFLK
jgi:thioredoxin-like negative regulator of GroEL